MAIKVTGGRSKAFKAVGVANARKRQAMRNSPNAISKITTKALGVTATGVGGVAPHVFLKAGGYPEFAFFGCMDKDDSRGNYYGTTKLVKGLFNRNETTEGSGVVHPIAKSIEVDTLAANSIYSDFEPGQEGGVVFPYADGALLLTYRRYGTNGTSTINTAPTIRVYPQGKPSYEAPEPVRPCDIHVNKKKVYGVRPDNMFVIWNVGSSEYTLFPFSAPGDVYSWCINQYNTALVGVRRDGPDDLNKYAYVQYEIKINSDGEEYPDFGSVSEATTNYDMLLAVDFNYNAPYKEGTTITRDEFFTVGTIMHHSVPSTNEILEAFFDPGEYEPDDFLSYNGPAGIGVKDVHTVLEVKSALPNGSNWLRYEKVIQHHDGITYQPFQIYGDKGEYVIGSGGPLVYYQFLQYNCIMRAMDLRYGFIGFAAIQLIPIGGSAVEFETQYREVLSVALGSVYGSFSASDEGLTAPPDTTPSPRAVNFSLTNSFQRVHTRGASSFNPDMDTAEASIYIQSLDKAYALDIIIKGDEIIGTNTNMINNYLSETKDTIFAPYDIADVELFTFEFNLEVSMIGAMGYSHYDGGYKSHSVYST